VIDTSCWGRRKVECQVHDNEAVKVEEEDEDEEKMDDFGVLPVVPLIYS